MINSLILKNIIRHVSGAALVAVALPALAMQEMQETELAEVSGTGIAIAIDDFGFYTAPTSYIELTGTAPTGGSWQRGDVRYYGLSLTGGQTGAGNGLEWSGGSGNSLGGAGTFCIEADPVGCPVGANGAADFAPIFSPYVIRAFEYEGYDYQGTFRTGTAGVNAMPSVLELIGPGDMDNWRWAFWGEIEVNRNSDHVIGAPNAGRTADTNGNGLAQFLQSQSIINGKNATKDGRPSILRLFRTQQGTAGVDPAANGTLGLTYQSALSGDFRFSVGQKAGSANQLHAVPDFDRREGLYLRDVDAFLPIGRLHYQALTIDATPDQSGNFIIDVNEIPNIPNIYNEFYCGNAAGCATTPESEDFFGRDVIAIANPNPETHGYVRWGDFSRSFTAADNGIIFSNAAGTTVHLGVARLEGMLIQKLRLTTLGAQ